ncbi:MAG: PLP-dependent aminotransferase family protein [Chloroflexota bacterium]
MEGTKGTLSGRAEPPASPILADWAQKMKRSVLRQMLAVVARPGILSFAGGLPAPELFPTADYAQAAAHVLATDAKALQYGPPFQPLKEHIVHLMAQRGVQCSAEQVFLTTGAQQALDILTRLLLNPGGQMILEKMAYPGIQQVIAPFQPRVWTVPTDLDTGLDVEAVASLLEEGVRPAFLYVITEAHNPLGVSLSRPKRWRLLELAAEYGVPIVEDDAYGFLRYEVGHEPPLRALDDQWVFYVGSFSKILAPALRLGWLVAPESLVNKLTVIKEAEDLESSAFTQRTVAAYLDAGHLLDHLTCLRREYARRRDTMLCALEQFFPQGSRWTRPAAGMFIWVELPGVVDTAELLKVALEQEQVAFIPGYAFAVNGQAAANCLRLNFSNATPERIVDGLERLGNVVKREA